MQGGCLVPAPAPGSPGQSVLLAPGSALMDSAIHHFIIRKDFHAAFEACEKGLEIVAKTEEQEPNCVSVRPKALQEGVEEIKTFSVKKIFHSDLMELAVYKSMVYVETQNPRQGELKASLCIVGIQALAELNQWHDVLTWVLQHYGESEQIPAKIMQMCILLYTKVEEQVEVREATRSWLHHSSNRGLPGYSSVAELYVLHVLLPLGQFSEAKELLRDDVGQLAFTKDQMQTALSILEDHEAKTTDQSHPIPKNVPAEEEKTTEGAVARRLNAVLRLLYRGLSSAGVTAWSRIIRRTAALLVLLYLLLIRMDPALPSAYVWILRLYGLWQQMWNAMFGPYYRASS